MQVPEQINLYIAEQPEWQRRIMSKLRQLIHASDETIIESWRMGAPHFEHDGAMIGIHAFKTCVSVWFHKGASLKDPHGLFKPSEKDQEREVRKYKLTEGEAIQEKAFTDLVKQAAKLDLALSKGADDHVSNGRALVVPPELEAVLRKDPTAWANWEAFSTSHKREYAEWVADGRKEETRKRRIAQALEMIRDGIAKDDKHRVDNP